MRILGYEWKEGARFPAEAIKDANVIGRHLELLRTQSNGALMPTDVVDDARHNNSPLHSFFEWDNTKAAEEHRLTQARGLIRSVVAIYKDGNGDKPLRRIRAFVHIPEIDRPHYLATDQAMRVPLTREIVLRQAWRALQAWKQRYRDLDEFARLFEEVDRLAKRLKLRE